jgi:phosphatidylethanolamine/phosphatidyl-N-methylethanolamine N-methyltransferase
LLDRISIPMRAFEGIAPPRLAVERQGSPHAPRLGLRWYFDKPLAASCPGVPARSSAADAADSFGRWRFFQKWLRDRSGIASITPSSRHLARLVAQPLRPVAHLRVIELGAGTGVITEAILVAGVAPHNVLVVERDPDMCRHLRARFPQLAIVLGDAAEIYEAAIEHGFAGPGELGAVISGLPLKYMPAERRYRALAGAVRLMGPSGMFVQYSLQPKCPVPRRLMRSLRLTSRFAGFTLRNIPPASVWVVTQASDPASGRQPGPRRRRLGILGSPPAAMLAREPRGFTAGGPITRARQDRSGSA